MKELLEYLVKALVDEPDQVQITEVEKDGALLFEVHVSPHDLGRVIGRQGRTANALRLVARAAARNRERVLVEIIS